MANCKKLMELTGDIPLGLYETPVPKARNLTPAMIGKIAESGRFNFLKDTSLSVNTLLQKIQAAKSVEGTPLKSVTQNCMLWTCDCCAFPLESTQPKPSLSTVALMEEGSKFGINYTMFPHTLI